MATLTLDTTGPTPDPLDASNGESISVINNLGAEVVLTLSPPGLLNPSNGSQLTVPASGWSGTVGNASGTYEYVEPGAKRNTRSGRINVN